MALHVSTDGLLSVHSAGDSPPTPDDQEEGEGSFHLLPKSSPRLPRRSSNEDLEAGSLTEPTSPLVPPSPSMGSPRRRVSFADNFGLELTAVKFYDEAEVPDVPEAMLDPLRDETDDDGVMRRLTLRFRSCDGMGTATNSTSPVATPSLSKGHLFLRPNFQVPASGSQLLAEVRAKQVAVESVIAEEDDPLCVRILVRVHNICYQKAVVVRRTFDGWTSFYDLLAEYLPGSNDGDTDQFAFSLALPLPLALEGTAMEFAVRFDTPLGTFWANNEKLNYGLDCCWADDVDGMVVSTPPTDEEHADKNLRSCLKMKSWEPSAETPQAEADVDDVKENDLANLDPLHPSRLKPSSPVENFVPLQLTVTSPSGEEEVLDGGDGKNRGLRLQVGGPEGLTVESPTDAGEVIKPEKRSRFSRNKRIAALCKKMKEDGGIHPFSHISLDYMDGNDKTEDSSSEATSPAGNFEADSKNNNLFENANLVTHGDADSRNDNLTTAKDVGDMAELSGNAAWNAGRNSTAQNHAGVAQRHLELAKVTEVEVSTVQTVVRSELPVVTKLDDDSSRVLVQNDEADALVVGSQGNVASPSAGERGGAEGSAGSLDTPQQELAADINMNVGMESDAVFESAAAAAATPLHQPTENVHSRYESYEDLRIQDEAETSPGSATDIDDVPALLGADESLDTEGKGACTDRPETGAEERSDKDVQLDYSKDERNEALEEEMEFDVVDTLQAPDDTDECVVVAADTAVEKAVVTECDVSVQTEDASLYEEVLPVDHSRGDYLTDIASMPLQAFEPADVCFSTFFHEHRVPSDHSEYDLGDADAVERHGEESPADSSPENDPLPCVHVGERHSDESVPPNEQVGMDLSGDDVQVDEELALSRAHLFSTEVASGDLKSLLEMHETSEDESITPTNTSQEQSPESIQHAEIAKGDIEKDLVNLASEDSWGDDEIVGEIPALERSSECVRTHPRLEKSDAEPEAETVGGFVCTLSKVGLSRRDRTEEVEVADREAGAEAALPQAEAPSAVAWRQDISEHEGPAAEELAEIADAFDERAEEQLPESEKIICSEPYLQLQDDPFFAAAALPSEPIQEAVSITTVVVETVPYVSPDVKDNRCVIQSAVLEEAQLDFPSRAEDVSGALEFFPKIANQASRIADASVPPEQAIGDEVKVQESIDVKWNLSARESEPAVLECPSSTEYALQEGVTDDLPINSTPRIDHLHHKQTEEHDNYPSYFPKGEQQEKEEDVEIEAADVAVTTKTQISHMGEESVKRYFESSDPDAQFSVGASSLNLQFDEVPVSEFMSGESELGEASASETNEEISVASIIVEPGSCNLSDVEDDSDVEESIDEIPDLEHYMEQFKPNHDFSDVTSNIQTIQGALLGVTSPLIEPPDSEDFEAAPPTHESQLRVSESTEVNVLNRPFLEKMLTAESHVMTEHSDQLFETPDLTPEVKYQYELEFPKAPNQTLWFPETSAAPIEHIVDLQTLNETRDIEKTPPVEEYSQADYSATDNLAADKRTPSSIPRQESSRESEQAFRCETHELPSEGKEDFDALVEPIIPRDQFNRIVDMVEENVKRFLDANAATLQVSAEDAGFAAEQWSLEGKEGDCAQPDMYREGETVPTVQLEYVLGDELVEETHFESTAAEPPLKLEAFDAAADTFETTLLLREAHDLEARADALLLTLSPLAAAEPPESKDDGAVTPELESVDQWLRETPPLLRRRPVSRINEGQLDEVAPSRSPPEQSLAEEEEERQVVEEVPATNSGDEDVLNDDTDAGVDLHFETQELATDLEPCATREELNKDVDLLEEEKRFPQAALAESQLGEKKSELEQEQAVDEILLCSHPEVQLTSGSLSGFAFAEPELEVLPVSVETEVAGVKSDAGEERYPNVSNVQDTVAGESGVEEAQVSPRWMNDFPAAKSGTPDIATNIEPGSAQDSSKAFGEAKQCRETRLLTEVGEIRDILQSMLVEVNQPVEEFTLRESVDATAAEGTGINEECGEMKGGIVGNVLVKDGDESLEKRAEPCTVEGTPLTEQPTSQAPQNIAGPDDEWPAFAATSDSSEDSSKHPVPDTNKVRPKPRRPRPTFPTVIVSEAIPEEDESRAFIEEEDSSSSTAGAAAWADVATAHGAEPSAGEVRLGRGAVAVVRNASSTEAGRSSTRLQQVFQKVLYFLAFVVFLVALYHYDIVVCCALYVVSLGVLYYENEITESGQRQFQPRSE